MVGTNLSNLTVEKKREVTVRELGGAMAPIWPTYLNDTNVILFMVDASSPSQISASTILLLTTLASDQLQSASVLVLLNKIDMSSSLSVSELMYLMQLEDLVLTASQTITVMQCCAKDGRGLKRYDPFLLNYMNNSWQENICFEEEVVVARQGDRIYITTK
ncbi:putative ADP-ribosylation factor-like protein 16 isoform X1 [Apostichopus japonicus]|uniref:Putative ADP-ribosylation factor-like protein 16 isoform X1 n=1 Tax=Stichopus japonicus TaxID=307972 RepID=A0A2G8KMF8_STIJA|nr:putative ADP-ribosylation factor-like protein 16 isoform X1 [Apostichopus japonicus]